MKLFVIFMLLLSTLAQPALAQSSAPAGSWVPLSGAALGKLLPGMDLGAVLKRTGEPYSMYLKPDGSFDGEYTTASGTGLKAYSGTWRLNGDAFCAQSEGKSEYCRGIEAQGDGGPYRFADDRLPVTIDAVRIVKGPTPDVPVTTIVVPGAEVPKDTARFSGVWTGKWDNTYDAVIAVTRIRPDGFAEIQYRYINYVGSPYTLSNVKFAKIQVDTISFNGISLTLRKNDATKAEGEVKGTNDAGNPVDRHATFQKQ